MALNLVSRCLSNVRFASPFVGQATPKFYTMLQSVQTQPNAGGSWNLTSVRTKTIDYFPKPRENERAKHSYKMRIKCRGGRLILMRRILRGKHVLAH